MEPIPSTITAAHAVKVLPRLEELLTAIDASSRKLQALASRLPVAVLLKHLRDLPQSDRAFVNAASLSDITTIISRTSAPAQPGQIVVLDASLPFPHVHICDDLVQATSHSQSLMLQPRQGWSAAWVAALAEYLLVTYPSTMYYSASSPHRYRAWCRTKLPPSMFPSQPTRQRIESHLIPLRTTITKLSNSVLTSDEKAHKLLAIVRTRANIPITRPSP